MKQIEKLTLPVVPVDLLDKTSQILELAQFTHGGSYCKLRQPSEKLMEWLNNTFGRPITASYVLIGHPMTLGLSPHKDQSGRLHGYHYVLQTGGKKVITAVYDDNLNVVQEEVLSTNIWYKLPTNEWHSVYGIEPGQTRIAISVTYIDDYPVDSPGGTKRSTQGGYYKGIVPEEWLAEQNSKVY
jgi:hypothetical protein